MPTWRGPAWDKRSRQARANPPNVCHFCQLPITPGQPLDADHIRTGDPTSPIIATHRSCNRSHGATHGNNQRTKRTLRTTR